MIVAAVVLILVPFALLVATQQSEWLKRGFTHHGTRTAVLLALLSVGSRIVLFTPWSPFADSLPNNGFLGVLLLGDEIVSAPYFAFIDAMRVHWQGSAHIPEAIPFTYLATVYFVVFRLAGAYSISEFRPDVRNDEPTESEYSWMNQMPRW